MNAIFDSRATQLITTAKCNALKSGQATAAAEEEEFAIYPLVLLKVGSVPSLAIDDDAILTQELCPWLLLLLQVYV